MISDSSDNEEEVSTMRRTTRTTAGVPPQRWGDDPAPSPAQAMTRSTVPPPVAQEPAGPPAPRSRPSRRGSIASSVASVDRRRREVEFESRKRELELQAEERRIEAEAEARWAETEAEQKRAEAEADRKRAADAAEAERRRVDIETRKSLADLQAQKELQQMQREMDLANLEEEERQSYSPWEGNSSEGEEDPRPRHGDGHTEVRVSSWLNQNSSPDPTSEQASPPLSPNPAARARQKIAETIARQPTFQPLAWQPAAQVQAKLPAGGWQAQERFPSWRPPAQRPPDQPPWRQPPTQQPWQPPRITRPPTVQVENGSFGFRPEKRSPPDPADIEQRAQFAPPEREPTPIDDLTRAMAQALGAAASNFRGGGAEKSSKFLARQSTSKDLPPFSGDPEDWPVFSAEFHNSTQMCEYTDSENISRLRKCLKGKALEAVKDLLLSPDNVIVIMRVLQLCFGRPNMIIESLVEKVRKFPAVKESKFETLLELSNAVRNAVSTMKSLKCTGHLNNPTIMKEVALKLPGMLQLEWGRVQAKVGEGNEPNLKDLSDWLEEQALAASYTSCLQTSATKPTEQRRQPHRVYTMAETSEDLGAEEEVREKKRTCAFCDKGSHEIGRCRSFSQKQVQERWDWAKENNMCFKCLKVGHVAPKCRSKKSCGKDGCPKSHHSLLHSTSKPSQPKQEEARSRETVAHVAAPINKSRQVLLKVLPVTLSGPEGSVEVYALLDEGSAVTLVDEGVAKKIGATGPEGILKLAYINATKEVSSQRVNLTIQGKGKKESYSLENVRTVPKLNLPGMTVRMKTLRTKWEHLEGIDVESMIDAKPTLLIGADNIHLIVTTEVHMGPTRHGPVVSRTKLGYTVHGPVKNHTYESNVTFFAWEEDEDDALENLVHDIFEAGSYMIGLDDIQAKREANKQKKREKGLYGMKPGPYLNETADVFHTTAEQMVGGESPQPKRKMKKIPMKKPKAPEKTPEEKREGRERYASCMAVCDAHWERVTGETAEVRTGLGGEFLSLYWEAKKKAGGRIPQNGPDLSEDAVSLHTTVKEKDDGTSAGTLQQPMAKDGKHGSQYLDVGSGIPTSGGGMSPWIDPAAAGTSKTSKPSPERRAGRTAPRCYMLGEGVVVEKFRPACPEMEDPGPGLPWKEAGPSALMGKAGKPMKKAGEG